MAVDGEAPEVGTDLTFAGSIKRVIEHWKPITGVILATISVTATVLMAYASRASESDLTAAKATLQEVDHTTKDLKARLEKLEQRETENNNNLNHNIEVLGGELRGRIDKLHDRFGDVQKEIGKLTGEISKPRGGSHGQ